MLNFKDLKIKVLFTLYFNTYMFIELSRCCLCNNSSVTGQCQAKLVCDW